MNAPVAGQPVALRMRPDLVVRRVRFGRHESYVIKDPLTGNFFRLLEEEFRILSMLDGEITWGELKARFENELAPRRLDYRRFQSLTWRLHRDGLLQSSAAGQAEQLIRRRVEQRRREWMETLGNPLAIRFRGVNPQRFVDWFYLRCRPLFSAWTLSACAALIVSAALLICVRMDELPRRLPEMRDFFSAGNILLLAAALSATKLLHELGHALVCRRFGGGCRELGVMFLVFTPCLYCDVSDAWLLRGKWARIAVSLAGIGVELTLAAACAILWYFSQPGTFNMLCLNVMVVCGVSTIVLNANPLLRYDGYYALADLLEVPNLWSRSRQALTRLLSSVCLGVDLSGSDDEVTPAHERLLVAYAVASIVYRWIVLFAILWFVYWLAKTHELESLAVPLIIVVLGGIVMGPVSRVIRYVTSPSVRARIRKTRLATSCVLATAVLAGIAWIPVRHRVSAEAVVEPLDASRVYVIAPGSLDTRVRSGQTVRRGQTLAVLNNPDLEQQQIRTDARLRAQSARRDFLRAVQAVDFQAAAEIPATEKKLEELGDQSTQLNRERRRLRLVAARDGVVIDPPTRRSTPESGGELPSWDGSPLDPRNRDAYLEKGTLLCLVGDPSRCEAVLRVRQEDVEFVAVGQPVTILLDAYPDQVLRGRIGRIAATNLGHARSNESSEQPTHYRDGESADLTEIVYEAKVELPRLARRAVVGSRGRARIDTGTRPLGARLYRIVQRTFAFSNSK